MARPQIIQQLRHDKFLCKAVFPAFVDSWNYVANRVENLKGDGDVIAQYGQGHITVDNSDPEHPVIRFNGELSGGASNHTGDANLSSHGLSSILLSSDNQYQLFEFDLSGTHHNLTSSDISSDVELVVRDNKNKCINYIPPYWISAQQLSVHTGDANESGHLLSSIYLSSDGQYELFDFHLSGTHHGLTRYDWQDGLSDEVEVVVRDNHTPGQSKVNYIPKSWLSAVGGDKNVIDTMRSIEYVSGPDPYYQLYDFNDYSTIDLDPIRNHGNFEFVVRYFNAVSNREEIKYGKLELSAIEPISGDANIIPITQNTIVTVEDQYGIKWHQLYRVGAQDPSIQVNCSFHTYDSGDYNYLLNEGNLWPNPEKQFVIYNQQTKRLEYVDVGLHIPKVSWSDLDDDVLPAISDVIIPEVSTIISADISAQISALSAQLSALDDKYWIKGEDKTENYGSSIGNSNQTQVIDLDNKRLDCQTSYDYWSTGSLYADYDLKAQVVEATQFIKIGNTTLNETQLQQLLALINNP